MSLYQIKTSYLEIIKEELKKIKCDNLNTLLYHFENNLGQQIVKRGLKVLGTGSTGMAGLGCLDYKCNMDLVFKLEKILTEYAYPKIRRNNFKHPVIAEVDLLKQMNERILFKGYAPNFCIYYTDFDCNYGLTSKINNLSGRHQEWVKVVRKEVASGRISDKLKVLVCEKCDNDLDNIIRKKKFSFIEWKVILFQICYMFTLAQYYIPGFRHNDLKLDNILANLNVPKADKFIHFKIFDIDFYLPDIGLITKMWDLDFSTSNDVKNSKVEDRWSDSFGCNSENNPIYDMFSLFNLSLEYNGKYIDSNMRSFMEDNLKTNDLDLLLLSRSPLKYINSYLVSIFTKYNPKKIGSIKHIIREIRSKPKNQLYSHIQQLINMYKTKFGEINLLNNEYHFWIENTGIDGKKYWVNWWHSTVSHTPPSYDEIPMVSDMFRQPMNLKKHPSFTLHGRLHGNSVGSINICPKDIKSFGDMLLDDFDDFLIKPTESYIMSSYNSNISISPQLLKRRDIFNKNLVRNNDTVPVKTPTPAKPVAMEASLNRTSASAASPSPEHESVNARNTSQSHKKKQKKSSTKKSRKAGVIDKFGKTHRGKDVKPGDCIFPFKYKKELYNDCVDTGKGPWCPTEISKTRGVKTWGYCE